MRRAITIGQGQLVEPNKVWSKCFSPFVSRIMKFTINRQMQIPSPLADKRFADREDPLTSRTGVPHTVPSAAMVHDVFPPLFPKRNTFFLAPAGSRSQGRKAPHQAVGNTHRYSQISRGEWGWGNSMGRGYRGRGSSFVKIK